MLLCSWRVGTIEQRQGNVRATGLPVASRDCGADRRARRSSRAIRAHRASPRESFCPGIRSVVISSQTDVSFLNVSRTGATLLEAPAPQSGRLGAALSLRPSCFYSAPGVGRRSSPNVSAPPRSAVLRRRKERLLSARDEAKAPQQNEECTASGVSGTPGDANYLEWTGSAGNSGRQCSRRSPWGFSAAPCSFLTTSSRCREIGARAAPVRPGSLRIPEQRPLRPQRMAAADPPCVSSPQSRVTAETTIATT